MPPPNRLPQKPNTFFQGQWRLPFMGWASRSNPALVDAIVASLSSPAEQTYHCLSRFTARDWVHTEFWLDTSGLALYFLDHVQVHGLSGAVDPHLLARLQQKRVDNKTRVAAMLEEFVSINRSFRNAGIRFANLKGFTFFPDSCSDLSLRHQSDFDFLIAPEDLALGCTLLEKHGFILTASNPSSVEFRTSGPVRTTLDGQYKAENRLSAELHIGTSGHHPDQHLKHDRRLDRLYTWQWGGECFPALAPADQMIGQALHLLGHLRHEHTRPSWLLEYRRHVLARHDDRDFWISLRALARESTQAPIAFGLSTLLASLLFGSFSPPELDAWTLESLPHRVRLWALHYGRKVVLADVPGTKLYLLLEGALRDLNPAEVKPVRLNRLIPLRRTDRIMLAGGHETLRSSLRRNAIEMRFILFRLRFHLQQGIRFLREARRWRRLCATGHDAGRSSVGCRCTRNPE